MTKRDALAFWEEFLLMASGADAGAEIDNPSEAFLNMARDGTYDKLTDNEYDALLFRTEEFSRFWDGKPKAAASDVLLRAIRVTDVPKPVLAGIAGMLAECSAATRYLSPWMSSQRMPVLRRDGIPDPGQYARGAAGRGRDVPAGDGNPSPREIYDGLRREVYGQDGACRAAAIVMHKHLSGRRTNALFHGPTGSGKSEIWRSLSRRFPGTVRMVDFSRISGDGWAGSMHMRDVFDGVDRRQLANEGVILVLDEADKVIAERVTNNKGFNYNDVIQNQLLKILDGDVVEFGREKDVEPLKVDCSRVSVVMLGAFEKLVGARSASRPIGFGGAGAAAKGEDAPVGYDELVEAGMRRELAGRVQLVVQVDALDLAGYEAILRGRVLKDPAVTCGLDVSMGPKAVRALASDAMDARLGVRWMTSQVATAVDSLLFDHPDARACVVKYPPCTAEPAKDRAARRGRAKPSGKPASPGGKPRDAGAPREEPDFALDPAEPWLQEEISWAEAAKMAQKTWDEDVDEDCLDESGNPVVRYAGPGPEAPPGADGARKGRRALRGGDAKAR